MRGDYQGNRAVRLASRDESLQGMFGREQDERGRSGDKDEEDTNEKGEEQPVTFATKVVFFQTRRKQAGDEQIN